MVLIVLALIVVALVALNCFYDVSGLLCYVAGVKGPAYDNFARRREEVKPFSDSDFN